jgi:hypothetical protein
MAIKGKTVTMLPPTLDRQTKAVLTEHKKKRVAGYARVSTDLEEQENSFAAQVDYYTNFINKNPDWEFVCVYSDDGQSATSMKKREGFNRMIADALDGKLDYIVTNAVITKGQFLCLKNRRTLRSNELRPPYSLGVSGISSLGTSPMNEKWISTCCDCFFHLCPGTLMAS